MARKTTRQRTADVIGLAEVADMLAKSKQRAYWWTNRPGFPAPVVIVAAFNAQGRARLWAREEVREWIACNWYRLGPEWLERYGEPWQVEAAAAAG